MQDCLLSVKGIKKMTKKCYIHLENPDGSKITKAVLVSESSVAQSVIDDFCSKCSSMLTASFRLRTSSGKYVDTLGRRSLLQLLDDNDIDELFVVPIENIPSATSTGIDNKKTIKCYVHLDTGSESFTKAVLVHQHSSLQSLATEVIDAFSKKTNTSLTSTHFIVTDRRKKPVELGRHKSLYDLLQDGDIDELFLHHSGEQFNVHIIPTPPPQEKVAEKPPVVLISTVPDAVEDIAKIEALLAKNSFRQARQLCEKAIETQKAASAIVWRTAADIHFKRKRFDDSLDLCTRGLIQHSTDVDLLLLQARCQLALRQYSDSIASITRAKNLLSSRKQSKTVKSLQFELLSLQIECLFEAGQHPQAAD